MRHSHLERIPANPGRNQPAIACCREHYHKLKSAILFLILLTSSAPALAGWSRDFSPPGPSNSVYCMTTFHDQLVAGGLFLTADDILVNNVACWDGTSWVPDRTVQSVS